MPKQRTLTPTEAFEKYFGAVNQLHTKPYPYPCSCGQFFLLGIEHDWMGHIRHVHYEHIANKPVPFEGE